MDIFLLITAGLFLAIGFLGCILPIVPGVTLSYIGIILLHFSSKVQFSSHFLIGWGLAVLLVQILDYIIPIWGTKKFGGSKYGIWGSTVGMFVGLLFGPWGIILGPFAGAIIGEALAGRHSTVAIRAGIGTFIGFLLGTLLKLIVAGLFIIYYYVEAIF